MQIITEGFTTKYIHDDKSETTIKGADSRQYDSAMNVISTYRNKYSVVISTSVGCQMGCQFCGIDSKVYKPLNSRQIIANVKEAIAHHFPEGSKRYIKLCFMGMGEPTLHPTVFSTIPSVIIRWATNNGYAAGVDGVDYGTILPEDRDPFFKHRFSALNEYLLESFKANPFVDYTNRSMVRLFFSLHTMRDYVRQTLMPNSLLKWDRVVKEVSDRGISVIMHYAFIYGVNDGQWDVLELIQFFREHPEYQLRVLRYNTNGRFQESVNIGDIWSVLSKKLPNAKFQISSGYSVRGSCGQFY